MPAKTRRLIEKAVLFLVLLAVSMVYIIPVLMMVLGSFKGQAQVLKFDLSIPEKWLFENYLHVFKTGNIARGYFNSLVTTVFSVALTLLAGALAGVVIARNTGKRSGGLYYFFLFGLTATMQMVTTFTLLKSLKIYGSYFGVVMVYVAVNLPYAIMSITSFVKNVPREIDEAAMIDGCGPVEAIFRVLIPILKPIMITNLIITAISVWNNFMIPLYFFNSSKKMTIPLTVYNFYGLYSRNWHYVFAAMTLTILPVVLLYLCLQKHIVEGMTAGAVKG